MYTKDLLYSNNYNNKNDTYIKKEKKKKENYIKNNIPKNVYKVVNYNDLLNSNSIDSNPNSFNNINQKIDNNLNNLDDIFNEINELDNKKYQKIKKTKISINSEDRDLENSIIPNNFDITLNKTYKNIEKIVLKDIYFPNSIPILNNFNNRFTWEYPVVNDINDIFIPDPSSNITYTKKINSDIKNLLPDIDYELIYSTKLNIKYASIDQFEKEFKNQLSYNYHHLKNQDDLNCVLHNNYLRIEREFTKNSNDISGIDIDEQQILFDININPLNHIVKLVNRFERLPIYSYQIVRDNTSNNDIFNKFSTTSPPLNKNKIYITLKESDYNDISMDNHSNYNIFPLVITNIKDIGNISKDIINYTPFYDYRIYGTTPENISTYKFYDKIEFEDSLGNKNSLIRLELSLSSGNLNGLYYNINGKIIQTKLTKTILTNKWLINILSNLDKNSIAEDYFLENEIETLPLIGRAVPIKLIKKIKNENNKDVLESVLDILGWSNENKSDNIQNASLKYDFYYIHSNIDSFQKNLFTNLVVNDSNIKVIFNYLSPQRKLNLELINDKYYFKSIPFIFIKIVPYIETKNIQNQLVRCYYNTNNINKNEYKKYFYERFNSNNEYFKPDTENILAKIYLKPGPLQTTILNDIDMEYVYYDKPLENLEKIKIIITDPYGRIINIENNFSFTIEIQETINVLNNTLLDTRRGDIVKTGLKN